MQSTNIGRYSVLSDILGDEDHLGDMDFKVTGTIDGITACQMDIKIKGLSYEILEKALKQAKEGRLSILEEMTKTIEKPADSVKEHSPKMIKIEIDGAFIVVEFRPGKEVLLHVSEIDWKRVEKVGDYLKIGDKIDVKYMGIDPRTRKQKVSRKVLIEKPEKK